MSTESRGQEMTSLALPPYNPVIPRSRPLTPGPFHLSSRQSGHEGGKGMCVSVGSCGK